MRGSDNASIAVIPGDGVGPEVTAVAESVLAQAAQDFGLSTSFDHFDWGSGHYLAHGRAMPADAAETLRAYDAILFGSLGTPALPDSEVVWSLIELRKQLGLTANVRPVLQWEGVPTVFARSRQADLVVVRENTEGEYSGVGGRSKIQDQGGCVAIAVAVHSERTIAGLARYAFRLARSRRNHLTLISKANAIHHAFSLWEEVVAEVGTEFADVDYEVCLVDAAAARMIQRPESFDVVLASNLFGDVLSEIGSTLSGGLGTSGSANVPTDGRRPGLFEPIHGSAPDIAGRGLANPIGAVLSAAMLLDHIGHAEIGDRIRSATRDAVALNRTPDLGGTATTAEFGDLILKNLAEDGSAGGGKVTSPRPNDPRELIRAYFRAVDANDVDGVINLFHDNIVYERPGYDAISGKARLRQFFAEERIIAQGHHDIEGVLVDGDRVAAWGSFVGTSRVGASLSETFCDIYQVRDCVIYRRRTFFFRPAV